MHVDLTAIFYDLGWHISMQKNRILYKLVGHIDKQLLDSYFGLRRIIPPMSTPQQPSEIAPMNAPTPLLNLNLPHPSSALGRSTR